jgi:hypothetical protein
MTVLIFLCVVITWFYLEFWLPHRTVYNEGLRYPAYQGDYRSRKKILDARDDFFMVQEMDGSKTIFTRVKDEPDQPD